MLPTQPAGISMITQDTQLRIERQELLRPKNYGLPEGR